MDNPTEYCSFVSVDYIICECGETFPDEDILKVHLDNDHAIVKVEKSVSQEVEWNWKEENEEEEEITEDGQTVQQEEEMQEPQTEQIYIVNSDIATLPIQLLEPDTIKQENIVVQYVDENGGFINNIQKIEEPQASGSTEESQEAAPQMAFKKVVFNKERMQQLNQVQTVIIAQKDNEHNYYDKEAGDVVFYFCETCGKSFMTEKSLNMHTNRKHGITRAKDKPKQPKYRNKKNSVCEVCGKKYASNAALRYHMRVHTGERPYKCMECSKTFTMPLFLQLHIRTHTGERPYQCPHCTKAFSNQAALVRHDRVHTGIKPYACPECGKSFTQSNSMKLHYQTVHLKMPAPYKSATRKLRDMKKEYVVMQQESKRRVFNIPKETVMYIKGKPSALKTVQEKLLFRHGTLAPHYDYVTEQDMPELQTDEYIIGTTT